MVSEGCCEKKLLYSTVQNRTELLVQYCMGVRCVNAQTDSLINLPRALQQLLYSTSDFPIRLAVKIKAWLSYNTQIHTA